MTKKLRHFSSAELTSTGISAGPETFSSMLVERGFGEKAGRVWWLFPEEAMFLVEEGYLQVLQRGRPLSPEELRRKLERKHKSFFRKYLVYKDLRKKGYLLKAGLKYGADFRVYEKGVAPRKGARGAREHARYLVWVLGEGDSLRPGTLVGMNRVAHSVKKLLWLAVVDNDLGITYNQMSRAVP